jgi:hypothetical protein
MRNEELGIRGEGLEVRGEGLGVSMPPPAISIMAMHKRHGHFFIDLFLWTCKDTHFS